MHNSDLIYWIALSHLPKWGSKKIVSLVIRTQESNIPIESLFSEEMRSFPGIARPDVKDLLEIKERFNDFQTLIEKLTSRNIRCINCLDKSYPSILKKNMETAGYPAVIYGVGNLNLLKEKCVAIVGSRNANPKALKFTEKVVELCSKNRCAIISGFAKGIDRKALDSAIEQKVPCIVVLPQGILSAEPDLREYEQYLTKGKLLFISTFFPKAPWSVGLAMARNTVVYALADEIFVAQSDNKGGTWEGVMNGLKQKRRIFVRIADPKEKVANDKLIMKGAIPVDQEGCIQKSDVLDKTSEQYDLFVKPS